MDAVAVDQRDRKSEVCELFRFEWNTRCQQGKDAQRFGDGKLDPKVAGES